MKINHVTVVGAGIMGHGIAQVAAQAGLQVRLFDSDKESLAKGLKKIEKGLAALTAKGGISENQSNEIISRIILSESLTESVADADLVIEAIVEDMEAKKALFSQLENTAPVKTIFASNTSSLSITEIGSITKCPDRFIGLHFFYPVPIMAGIEVIQGIETSEATLESILEFIRLIGKEPLFSKDFPGFIVNRMLPLLVNEAFFLLWQGIGSPEDIDKACTLNLHHPIGPLKLADISGLDTLLAVLEYLHQEFGEKYRPCPLLKQLVKAGHLGRKTGKGVFDYQTG